MNREILTISSLPVITNTKAIKLMALALLLASICLLLSRTLVSANYSAPSWWSGDTCDSTHYTAGNPGDTPNLMATWQGIEACGWGPNQYPYNWPDVSVTFPGASAAENEWECTELVKRYLQIAYGATSLGSTNGDKVVANYASAYPSKFAAITNDGNTQIFPKVGDVLSYSDVHTAIVTGVTVTNQASGDATLTLLEQNASESGTTTQQVSSWKIKGDIDDPNDTRSDTVTGWLTPLVWTNNSPSGSSDTLNAISASSPSDVWAVGIEGTSGSYGITYNYNGTSWTKYKPTTVGTNNWLYGVTSDSSGNAWTVGYDSNGSQFVTLAYKWNGSAWVHEASDNGSSSPNENDLKAVSTDNSGDVYAVGYYYDGSTYKPLIEEWNGTKFANQGISLPSGCTSGYLYGVSVYSSSNIWAAGYGACSSNPEYLIYHYDGTSWTSSEGPSATRLLSIKAVSNNEAWAVGSKSSAPSKPFIMHYTSAGGWQEDTSNTFSVTYASGFNSVDADSPNDVWAVGILNTSLLTLHYNGSSWSQVGTSISWPTGLNGVAVNSGTAWASGYTGSSPYLPLVLQSL